MRKISAALFISLDGVVEAPDQWQFDVFDEDMAKGMDRALAEIDTVLLGRKTYQEWAEYWPNATSDLDYADFINNTPKHVVSTTLDKVDWKNSTLIKDNLSEELSKLKKQPGKTIGVQGSPTLVRSLLKEGLLDELMLMFHPVVAGRGKRLFDDGDDVKRLKLVDSSVTGSGVAILSYQPRR
jgi:dihydrofolate reductase